MIRLLRFIALGLSLGIGAGLGAQTGAESVTLSIDELVRQTLAGDPGLQAAIFDWQAAGAKADAANLRRIPSISGSYAFQQLSELPATSMTIDSEVAGRHTAITMTYPASSSTYNAFGLNLQYPIFAGFRVHEAAMLAGLAADGKLVASAGVRNALAFEARRAYWETVRAGLQAKTLEKNLEMATLTRQQMATQFAQGLATSSDRLNAEQRWQQADQDLGDAWINLERWQLVLANLRGAPAGQQAHLSSPVDQDSFPGLDAGAGEDSLIEQALRQRPETRGAAISAQAAVHGMGLAAAPLYPTVVLLGNLTNADPNQRAPYVGDVYTFTWSAGLQVSWDLGAIPAAIAETVSADYSRQKADADIQKQTNAVSLDVRTCLLTLRRLERDLGLMQGLVDQAAENLRVVSAKFGTGLVNESQVLDAQLAALRSDLAVSSRRIDLQIARADLVRALGIAVQK